MASLSKVCCLEDKVLSGGGDLCTSTVYAIGGLRCDNQTVGGTTKLWFKVGMPTISSTESDQDIEVTISANQP